MLQTYFKIAWRNILKNKVYSIINVTGLAIGFACCLAIGLFVFDEFSYDRFHANYGNIYRVVEDQIQSNELYHVAATPGPLAPALTRDFPELLQATRIGREGGLLMLGQKAIEVQSIVTVDTAFFRLFSFPLVLGNPNKVFHGPNEVILSESMADQFFGLDWRKKAILGKLFQFNNQQTLILAGVAQNPPDHSSIQFDVLLPFEFEAPYNKNMNNWNSNNYLTFIQLKPGTNLKSFQGKIRLYLKRYSAQTFLPTFLLLQPLRDIYLKSKFDFKTDWGKRSNIIYTRIFITVGLMVLLIAVVNFVNLATARASERAREVGVRKTIGAQRSSLVLQFLSESLLLTSVAIAVGFLLLLALIPLFNEISGKNMTVPFQVPFWLILICFTLIVGVLSGLYPAFFLSSFRPVRVLKGVIDIKSAKAFRQSLVVGQFVLSIVLTIGTIVIYRQLNYMQNKKLGFDKSQLLYLRLKGNLHNKEILLKRAIQSLPGVFQVSGASGNLIDVTSSTTGFGWEGQSPKDNFLITQMNVDDDFFKTTGMSFISGRNFSAQIISDTATDTGPFIVNETAARRMGYTASTALGKTVNLWNTKGEIIGVLKDFNFRPLHVSIEPFLFRFRLGSGSDKYSSLFIKIKAGSMQKALMDLGILYKKYEPNYPISFGFVDQDLEIQYLAEQLTAKIILCFSIMAIFIACLGLYGLATFTTRQRIKEIGIRKVLGASVTSVVTLLSKDFLMLVLMAVLIASPIAWVAMNRWLMDFAYKINIEWWMFVLTGLLALGIALFTVSFQSIKAAILNPANSLRSE
jgi:putative ABC transport system permease protein